MPIYKDLLKRITAHDKIVTPFSNSFISF